jgi:hypothetical protein
MHSLGKVQFCMLNVDGIYSNNLAIKANVNTYILIHVFQTEISSYLFYKDNSSTKCFQMILRLEGSV